MELYKRILLLLDCSNADNRIIKHVLKLAEIHKSKVFLLHVVHSHTLDQNRFLSEKTDAYMEEKKKLFTAKDIEVETIIISGEPQKEICSELEASEYDLIAMGTHGHGKFFDFLYGSVSDCLKHRTSTPILLIKA